MQTGTPATSRFHVRVALHRLIHGLIQFAEFRRLLPDQVWSQFGNARSDAGGVGWQVEWAQRANLTVADDTFVCFNSDDRAVKNVD